MVAAGSCPYYVGVVSAADRGDLAGQGLTCDPGGGRWRLPEGEVERMFQRDRSTKPGHSGIGLALVSSVARRCRASIDVEHPRGGGLSVTVTFA